MSQDDNAGIPQDLITVDDYIAEEASYDFVQTLNVFCSVVVVVNG